MKILHVTNIAQNAYVNASILARFGHSGDVAALDLYHFACSPEWYELTEGDLPAKALEDTFFPDFYALNQAMPVVPDWVAHGPQANVLSYLKLKNTNDPHTSIAQAAMSYLRFKATMLRTTMPQKIMYGEGAFHAHLDAYDLPTELKRRIVAGRMHDHVVHVIQQRLFAYIDRKSVLELYPPFQRSYLDSLLTIDEPLRRVLGPLRESGLTEALGIEWPGPADTDSLPHVEGASRAQLSAHGFYVDQWRALSRHYDACIFYSDSPSIALLAQLPQWAGLENGTIRSIPFEDTVQGHLVRDGYLKAAKVFITNTDYVTAKPRLEFTDRQRVYIPHPFDETRADAFNATHPVPQPDDCAVFLCPARQDWVANDPKWSKGNDRYFKAAAQLLEQYRGRFKLVCVEWGTDLGASRDLIKSLGLEGHVEWVPAMAKRALWREMRNAACIIDQFVISVVSGVGFETMALARPLLTRDDYTTNETFFGAATPTLAAVTVEEIAARMRFVIEDRAGAEDVGRRAHDWIKQYHSAERIVALQIEAFEDMRRSSSAIEGIEH